ncbi:MAG: hypothetical protein GX638_10790, partial [Crenarchaeota archaeon]|nr:hypothetical protein [Thermoproteota archaeon]
MQQWLLVFLGLLLIGSIQLSVPVSEVLADPNLDNGWENTYFNFVGEGCCIIQTQDYGFAVAGSSQG